MLSQIRRLPDVLCVVLLVSCSGESTKTGGADPPKLAPSVEPGSVSSKALAAPSATEARTMGFTRLSAEATGVGFINPLDTSHSLSHLYATEKVCGGVAAGDVNGDGLPDLYFTSGPQQNRLYLQTGDFQFQEATSAGVDGGNAWAAGASMVDIDSDGDLDIYVANYAVANQLFINDGTAKFREAAAEFGLDRVSASHMPTFADYDRDGDLDLYLLTNRFHSVNGKPKSSDVLRFNVVDGAPRISFSDPGLGNYFAPYQAGAQADGRPIFKIQKVAQQDVLFRNDGGQFVDVSAEAGIRGTGFGLSATWWDFNLDGWTDIWVGNDFDDPDRVYRNNGDGTFTDIVKEATPHISWFSMGADFADLSGDARPDFLIADMSGTNHFKQKVNMGSMGAKADFLRDADPQQYMRNALFINTGTGRFQEAAQMAGLANSDWTWTVKLSDFDCDGLPDVFMTNGMSKNFNESDNGAVIPQPGENEWQRHVRAGTAELREQNLAFQNLGDLQFKDVSKAWGLDHVGMSFSTAHTDLDRDGDLDLVVSNLDEPVSIYRNNANGGNRLLIELRGVSSNSRGYGAKLRLEAAGRTQIRELTPVRGYLASNEDIVHFGLGDADAVEKLVIDWPSGHRHELTDLKANHLYTIAEPAGEASRSIPAPVESIYKSSDLLSKARHKENEFDDFERQPLLPNQMSRLGPGQAWGDVDGDGDEDLWISGAAGVAGSILINGGAQGFTAASVPAFAVDKASEDMGGLWFDADADGDMDLYVVSGGNEFSPGAAPLQDRLYLNDAGTLTKAEAGVLPENRTSGGTVCGADFDRDGDIDLFVGTRQIPGAYPASEPSQLLRNNGGRFEDVSAELLDAVVAKNLVSSAIWSDADGDGWVDLLLANEWGPVRLLRNQNGKLVDFTEAAGLAKFSGWWNGLTAADLDSDGDIDYVATNFGMNTKYHADPKHPALIYYGDFEGSGRRRIIEAKFEGDTLYPVRGRSCSTDAMPHLGNAFTSFKGFAISELSEIYQPERLDDSLTLEVNALESGVFLNVAKPGEAPQFRFSPLPRIAQVAPSFGAVTVDANADGHPDLYLAQNFHSPQVETGHMAGGVSQLLLGKGDGTFDPVSPDRSGLIVGGDAASLTRVDLNGDGAPDFVVGVNDGATMSFVHGSPAGKTLWVRLAGLQANPTAIGARIRVMLDDGRKLTAEQRAGDGYLSQSVAMLPFTIPSGAKVSGMTVRWPDGSDAEVTEIAQEGVFTIRQ